MSRDMRARLQEYFQLWQAARFFDEPFVRRDYFAVDLGDRPAKMLFDGVIEPI
jgi:hypothetical protein